MFCVRRSNLKKKSETSGTYYPYITQILQIIETVTVNTFNPNVQSKNDHLYPSSLNHIHIIILMYDSEQCGI